MTPPSKKQITSALVLASVLAVSTALALRANGRVWWCSCGSLIPWSWDIWSIHNSQHLWDPYTFTHVLHGFVFLALLSFLRAPYSLKIVAAMTIECLWELIENSSYIIDRYRAATLSVGYQGDSILNSLSDIGACVFGFWLASKLRPRTALAVFLLIEITLALSIRDNLTLSAGMLIYPIPAIKRWQMMASPFPISN